MHGDRNNPRQRQKLVQPPSYDELDQQYFDEYGIPEDSFRATGQHIRHEREAARILRQSQWWKQVRSKGVCHYCGKRVAPSELTMDHVIPIARGGRSIPANIVPCCKSCNTAKNSKFTMDFTPDSPSPDTP